VLFGAAALGSVRPERADAVLEQIGAAGVNHINTVRGSPDTIRRCATAC
jgi:hypothetical protein